MQDLFKVDVAPKSPVSGRANPADFDVVESGVYGARFRQVFGTPL
jgi:hypothetical protein